MITKSELKAVQKQTGEMIRQANILMTDEERDKIQVADFGLSNTVETLQWLEEQVLR